MSGWREVGRAWPMVTIRRIDDDGEAYGDANVVDLTAGSVNYRRDEHGLWAEVGSLRQGRHYEPAISILLCDDPGPL